MTKRKSKAEREAEREAELKASACRDLHRQADELLARDAYRQGKTPPRYPPPMPEAALYAS